MVVATKVPWWLTASGVLPGLYFAIAARGIIGSAATVTAEPVDADPRPVLVILLVARLRAVSAAMEAAVLLEAVCVELTVPATALVDWLPFTVPPVVLIQRLLSVSGLCQNFGSTSITTWYWFSAL